MGRLDFVYNPAAMRLRPLLRKTSVGEATSYR